MNERPSVCIVGGGMITRVQLLPSIFQLQRLGVVGEVHVCALNVGPLRELADDATLGGAFPGQAFTAHPSLESEADVNHPDMYREVIARLPKQSIVVVALPDQLHYGALEVALEHDQHVCCVKPLVLEHRQATHIGRLAHERGLVVGIEYHKRFDYRSLMARQQYRAGEFGQFRLGQASLHEPWSYRHSNFQNWCTCENSDMFCYVACHYVDLVHFITGLLPSGVSVYGIRERYPNGQEGFLWTDGRVLWENGACLNVQNSLGYPEQGPGGNFQGLRLHCQGDDEGSMIVHNDQYRGVEQSRLAQDGGPEGRLYTQPNPDYFQYLEMGGVGRVPVGYGYRSIEYIVQAIRQIREESAGLDGAQALERRREGIERLDAEGIMATPRNSGYNELVLQAARLSLLNDGRQVDIRYGAEAGVQLRQYE